MPGRKSAQKPIRKREQGVDLLQVKDKEAKKGCKRHSYIFLKNGARFSSILNFGQRYFLESDKPHF